MSGCAWVLALGLAACKPATEAAVAQDVDDAPKIEAPAPKREAVARDERAAVLELPQAIDDLVAVVDGRLMCSDGPQCGGTAEWSACDVKPKLHTGDRVHVIDADGVQTLSVTVEDGGAVVQAGRGPLRLAMMMKPDAGARLRDVEIETTVADARAIEAWLHKRVGTRFRAVGQIRGKFGGGIDRIVVFAPRSATLEAGTRRSDQAVALAGNEPRDVMPFVKTVEGHGETWEEGVTGLHPAKLVDLDGDGIDEVLWVGQAAIDELVTSLDITFFFDGRFGRHTVSSCSYNGCEAFLPVEACPKGTVKRR